MVYFRIQLRALYYKLLNVADGARGRSFPHDAIRQLFDFNNAHTQERLSVPFVFQDVT